MSKFTSLVVGIVALLATSQTPTLSAEYYDVTDVRPSDALNMRDVQPGVDEATNAKIIGEIPSDAKDVAATGRTFQIGSATWREVTYEGATGWVNEKFLTMGSKPSEWSDNEKLSCGGTEPFWSYEIAGGKAVLKDPGAEGEGSSDLSVRARLPGIGRRGLWFVYAESEDKSQGLSAMINRSGQCSDGMSDHLFDLEIFLMGFIPGEGPVQGCCTIQAK